MRLPVSESWTCMNRDLNRFRIQPFVQDTVPNTMGAGIHDELGRLGACSRTSPTRQPISDFVQGGSFDSMLRSPWASLRSCSKRSRKRGTGQSSVLVVILALFVQLARPSVLGCESRPTPQHGCAGGASTARGVCDPTAHHRIQSLYGDVTS